MEQRWKVLLITSVGLFMASLDLFIVNIAFPDLARDFNGASLPSLSWVLNAYAIVFAALLVPAGRIADRVGRKRVFIAGLLLFSAASALCALAPSVPFLVGARVLQAAGGAMMLPTTLGLILPAFPPAQRPLAIGIWSAVGGVAAALGPPIGGLLVQLDWRWIFVVNVPIGIVTAIVAWRALQEVREPEDGRPDLLGAAELALGIGLLTLGIVKGPEWGWADPAHARLLRRRGRAGRRLRRPLRPPRGAGDRAAAAARALLRPRQPRRHGLLRRLRRDAALRRPAADRSLGLLGAEGRPRALARPAHRGDLRHPLGAARRPHRAAPGRRRGRPHLRHRLRRDPRHGRQRTGLRLSFLPGFVLGGAGVGMVLGTLPAAATAALPPSRFATGTAVFGMARQLGSAIGVAVLVALLNDSTGGDLLAGLQRGWAFALGAGLGTAALALAFGPAARPAAAPEPTPQPSAELAAQRGVA